MSDNLEPPAEAAPRSSVPADPMAAKPRRADVVAAYRWLLGRDPEDGGVVLRHLAAAESLAVLRGRLMDSPEFRKLLEAAPLPAIPLDAPPMPIELAASPASLALMLAELSAGWTRLFETAPHWAALRDRRFKPQRFEAHRSEFFASGRQDRDLVEAALIRNGIAPGQLGGVLDFGCGVGRATLHLAGLCPEVTGVDIAAPALRLARAEAEARLMDHIAWVQARPDEPMPGRGYGLWFSRRVLQHCPPPLARRLLGLAFAGLAPAGVAIFQVPTFGIGYRYGADHVISTAAPADELHVLPQAEILALAAAAGLAVLEVQEDTQAGLDRARFVSHLFVLRKPG